MALQIWVGVRNVSFSCQFGYGRTYWEGEGVARNFERFKTRPSRFGRLAPQIERWVSRKVIRSVLRGGMLRHFVGKERRRGIERFEEGTRGAREVK